MALGAISAATGEPQTAGIGAGLLFAVAIMSEMSWRLRKSRRRADELTSARVRAARGEIDGVDRELARIAREGDPINAASAYSMLAEFAE